MRNSLFGISFGICLFALSCLNGCATPKQAPLPVGALRLGVAQFTKPSSPAAMLAGYQSENSKPISQEVLTRLDAQLAHTLTAQSKNIFLSADKAKQCYEQLRAKQNFPRQAALRTWAAVGRCMEVDLLLVPQVHLWQERSGSQVGTVIPAGICMDSYIIDVRDETLISRSHFEEIQTPLNDNLLNAGKFFSRGAKWLSADELANEAMQQTIRELGL